jgi:hypothetical protein
MPTFNARCATVAKVFGKRQVDRDDPSFVDFLYVRRDLAIVVDAESGHRDPQYICEIQDLDYCKDDEMIRQALARIRKRDGDRIYQEAATYLRKAAHV